MQYLTPRLKSILAISHSLSFSYTYKATALIHRTHKEFTVSPTACIHTYYDTLFIVAEENSLKLHTGWIWIFSFK